VSALQARLGDGGCGLVIDKALPIGATPLKRIAISGPDDGGRAEAPILRERTLR
jgi:hypothetical protein